MNNIAQVMYDNAAVKGVPLGGTFELTPLCNMNCRMCYIRMTREEMEKAGTMRSVEEWLSLAGQAKKEGMLFLLLTGGEPFLYPGFWELYTALKEMGFLISINTNGVLLDDEKISRLIQNPPYKINITVYGGSDETYSKLCRCENGFTKATEAVKKLRAAGIYVKLNGSITPFNCDDISACYDFAKSVNSPAQLGAYMFPPMRRENKATERFDAASAGKYQAIIDKTRLSPEELANTHKRIELCAKLSRCDESSLMFRCRAGRSSFWVNWKGEMTPCGMLELFTEYPFRDGFRECWQRINSAVKAQKVLESCAGCPERNICKVCPAIAYAESGSFNEKPEYMCEMTRAWKEEMLK